MPDYDLLLPVWLLLGGASSAISTPIGRLLRRSSAPPDHPAYFAAQFSLSHACRLLTYLLASWLRAVLGLSGAGLMLAVMALAGLILAVLAWPTDDPEVLDHVHTGLDAEDPHLDGARPVPAGFQHAHPYVIYVIDRHYHFWPRNGAAAQSIGK
jgi:hypothetical protein